MPCDYSKYPDNWKTEIRPRILKRAKNRCELCGVENGDFIRPVKCCNEPIFDERGICCSCRKRVPLVVLTIMHMDHDTTNNDYSNLRAGCQRCHNRYDAAHRQKNARETRRRKRAEKEPALPGMARMI